MKTVAVIMAGGKGERLWPMSTKEHPKQFLKLVDKNKTMVQLTLDRIKKFLDLKDIYVVGLQEHQDIVKEQLPEVPDENLIFLSEARNTAPLIATMTILIKQKYQDANVIVLASDSYIHNTDLFIDTLKNGVSSLEKDNIVTIGIVPDRIETGYGYIQLGKKMEKKEGYQVKKFVEKPSYDIARKYYESGEFLWNSGMFLWRNNYIYECFRLYCPNIFDCMQGMESSDYSRFDHWYRQMEATSIDYAVMEKADNILVLPGTFGWDDVGSWISVERLRSADEFGNVLEGNVVIQDCNRNIIIGDDPNFTIAMVGIQDQVIVKNENTILLMDKSHCGDIKKVLEKIK